MAAGVPSFKLYLAYAGLRLDDAQLYRALKAVADVGGLPIVHCENGPVCETLRAEAVAQGDRSPIHHALTRPPRQEAEAMSRAIDFAALAKSPLYVVHVSCEESMSRIQAARARRRGAVAASLRRDLPAIPAAEQGSAGRARRRAADLRAAAPDGGGQRGLVGRAGLWGSGRAGDRPLPLYSAAEKSGHADFTTIPGGLPSIEARLSLAHHFGSARLTLERWVEVCCTNPARIFGLARKGQIAPGFDADLVIFDPSRWVTIQAGQTLHERVDWSPYEGLRVQGWPRDVLSRGRVSCAMGSSSGQPGWGHFQMRRT